MEGIAVAKKKPRSDGPPPGPTVGIKASPEWKAWLAEFADSERVNAAILIDHALNQYAKTKGFKLPPKR